MMSVPRSVADVLDEHVTLELECLDRMYLNVYQPRLQYDLGVVNFFRFHRGHTFASSALMEPISNAFIANVEDFVKRQRVPLITFLKGERKEDIVLPHRLAAKGRERVLVVGKAQEKTPVFRTERRRNPETGATYPWIVKTTAMVNHFYFYCFDDDFGPFFLKVCTYFPYNAKLCLNGHEYLKRQLTKEKIAFEELDNGVLSCANPKRMQQIADGLSAQKIAALLAKWQKILPQPFSAQDTAAGYRYDVSILQCECSLTQVLDRPQSGRVFFENVIRENLDMGRPDQVQLIFDRRVTKRTPGRFRTRVLTEGVTPSLHVDYKHSKIKQYHKEGRALRTETTINDPRDFGIGKRLQNLSALRKIGFDANRRLLNVQRISHDPILGEAEFQKLNSSVAASGQRAGPLRFGDPKVQTLLSVLLLFRLLTRGFSNRDLREHWAPLLGTTPESLTSGQLTYQLRRLRLHGLIERIPKTHRYQLTASGARTIDKYTQIYNRVLRPEFADSHDSTPSLKT
jgi:DNA-binding HxlR family transcriptional regulator